MSHYWKISCHARMTFYFTFLSHYTLSLTFNIQDMRLLVMAGIIELISPAVQKIFCKKFEKYYLHKWSGKVCFWWLYRNSIFLRYSVSKNVCFISCSIILQKTISNPKGKRLWLKKIEKILLYVFIQNKHTSNSIKSFAI